MVVPFLRKTQWQRELLKVVAPLAKNHKGELQSPEIQRASILDDLKKSKEMLEAMLDKSVKHLCFTLGGWLSINCGSRKASRI